MTPGAKFGRFVRRWTGGRDEGAFAPMVAVVAIALISSIGLAVDGGGRMRALEHADNVAAEAARAGGQALDLGKAVNGTADVIDPATAKAAAKAYLKDAGVSGSVSISGDHRTITVRTQVPYKPVFLGLIGAKTWTETGSATAVLVTE